MPIPATLLRLRTALSRYLPRACGLAACLALAGAMAVAPAASARSASSATMPKLDHVFVIMEENNGYSDVIGNPAAPNLNNLANTFGLETNYFGVSRAAVNPITLACLAAARSTSLVTTRTGRTRSTRRA